MLTKAQFAHKGLAEVYEEERSASVPEKQWGRCVRLLDSLDAATVPEDLQLPGNGFRITEEVYSVNVDHANSITFRWKDGKPADIDYV